MEKCKLPHKTHKKENSMEILLTILFKLLRRVNFRVENPILWNDESSADYTAATAAPTKITQMYHKRPIILSYV